MFYKKVMAAFCEVCGKEQLLIKADVEGSVLSVCKECASFGKIITARQLLNIHLVQKKSSYQTVPEITEEIVEDAGEKVKNAREKRSMTQEELARKLAERESIVQKIESGTFSPNLELAKKIERALHIVLIEKIQEEIPVADEGKKSTGFTIGDFLAKKK